MGRFKVRQLRSLRFRLPLVVAGAFALLATFSPPANAALIRYYNMEGVTVTPPYPVNLDSHLPAVEVGAGTNTLFLDNGTPGVPYPSTRTSAETGLAGNIAPGDPAANLNSIGFSRNGLAPLGVEIFMPSSFGIYDVTSVSFAYARAGNGYTSVQLQMSTNGGATFTTNITGVLTLTGTVFTITLPSGTTMNISNLALRLLFTGGTSNGNDLQFQLDNIQINGAVPEPATVAAGLLGVLGLCWHQRRRLIRSVRFQRASG
jgi:hypothetical protein